MKKLFIIFFVVLGLAGTGTAGYYAWNSPKEEAALTEKIGEVETVEETKEISDAADTDSSGIDDWGACTQTSQISKPGGDDVGWSDVKLYQATSADGKTFENEKVIVIGGGVPSVTTGPDGIIVAVFQWWSPEDNEDAYNKVAVIFSEDNGGSWSDPQMICLKGFPTDWQAPYDPTITVTEEGDYRLFFTTHELGMDVDFFYGSAISEDGIHYVFEEGERFRITGGDVVDGSVARAGENWYMLAPLAKQDGKAVDAVSADGLTFTQSSSDRSSQMKWVGNMTNVNGTIRFYGGGRGSLAYSETTDGKSWSAPVATNIDGGDPGITTTEDGEFLLIYVEPYVQPKE